MRISILAATAAALALAATSASAGNDTTNNQLNRATSQVGQLNLALTTVKAGLDASSAAIGNSVSVDTNIAATGTGANTSFSSIQVNQQTSQRAVTNVTLASVGGFADIASQAIGNSGSFSSENGKLAAKTWQATAGAEALNSIGQWQAAGAFRGYGYRTDRTDNLGEGVAFQLNDSTSQVATTNVNLTTLKAGADIAATSVGNTLTFEAGKNASALAYQINTSTSQVANVNVGPLVSVNGFANVSTAAIGNNTSWLSAAGYDSADGINFQTNVNASQKAITNIGAAKFGNGLVAGAVAAGNIANVGIRN